MNVETMATYNCVKFWEVVSRTVENLASGVWFHSFKMKTDSKSVLCICQQIDHLKGATPCFFSPSPWKSVEELTSFNPNQCFE